MLVRLSSLCPNAILQRECSLQVNWKCVISHWVGWESSPLIQGRVLRPGTGGIKQVTVSDAFEQPLPVCLARFREAVNRRPSNEYNEQS